MPTLADIPFKLDPAALMEKIRIEPDSEDAREFEQFLEQVRSVARPKALYREVFIEARGSDTVTLGGVTFKSLVLRKNLDKVERVFAFVCTCGREVDGLLPDRGDFLKGYWMDTIKMALLGAARENLTRHLTRQYALGKTATMNPGSGDATLWPIEQQRELFALLGDVKGQIGVELTDSFLMIPNKTVSGIRFPTEVDFRSCQLCHRADCPSRGAPFDEKLWTAMQHE